MSDQEPVRVVTAQEAGTASRRLSEEIRRRIRDPSAELVAGAPTTETGTLVWPIVDRRDPGFWLGAAGSEEEARRLVRDVGGRVELAAMAGR